MRALVVYCHPSPDSFTAAVRDVVIAKLTAAGAECRVIDVYAENFPPVLSRAEWDSYLDGPQTGSPLAPHIQALRDCDTLIFVYPTWWYGLPAALKGWLDRVLLPDVAFRLPETGDIIPTLTHIERLGCFTTCGASRLLTWFVGAPGRRTILRGIRLLCARRCRTAFAAHYSMDTATPESRAAHLVRVGRAMDRLIGKPARGSLPAAGTAQARDA
ncbi:NAD(P)H-dependent oxidoreductase [Halovulum dunhuangense]|uniref:NAD(P)H-dependent oxidoreductase n=1 Tax=Halovulum dunhuangense TaxID=1505036 RepID=A0A849L438_9RHOB|nr:NAD(P)H-dependent oxidoreductase [Halovulum dunhuangense]NNU81116.1 NAD(P)H-dependent oxidoreductase [Halovulum dunhuangense]